MGLTSTLKSFIGKDQIYVDTQIISHNIFLTEKQVNNINKQDQKKNYFHDKPDKYKNIREIIPLGKKNRKISERDIAVFKKRFSFLKDKYEKLTMRSYVYEGTDFKDNLLTVWWGS
jgi:hypothetical protein